MNEITDEMIRDSEQTSRDTLRKSIRPIDGKIHAVLKFTDTNPLPKYMKTYKPYSHKETLDSLNSPEWNLNQPIQDLIRKYDFDSIIEKFDSKNIIQCFGEMYITIFQILKFNFFLHSKKYLDSEDKWKLFKGNRFEKANEYTMLELNYFYNLITKDEKEIIDDFREKRNSISHSFDQKFTNEELRKSIEQTNIIVLKYLVSLEI